MKLLTALFALPLVGCSLIPELVGTVVEGSGRAKTEARAIGGFTALRHDGVGDIDVQVGPAVKLSVKADDNLLSKIVTRVEGGVLLVKTTENIHPKTKIKMTLTVPALDRVELNGVGDIRVRNVHGRNFAAKLNGVGDLSVEGRIAELEAELNGVGDLYLRNLTARDAVVRSNGTGDTDVYATNRLRIDLKGVGDVTYRGKPAKLDVARNGIGQVARH